MKIDLSKFRQTFLQESAEHVESMETDLLALRSAPDDVEILNAIFRSAHSIKGGAGSFGLTNLVRFTHGLESLLDRLRSLEMPATAEVISLLLRAIDVVRVLLDCDADADMPEGAGALAEQIGHLCGGDPASTQETQTRVAEARAVADGTKGPTQAAVLKFYRVSFRPHRDLFSSGTNPIVLLRNLAALGTVSVCQLHADDLPPLVELDPTQCYLSWTIELAASCEDGELREVFEFVEHLADVSVGRVDQQEKAEQGLALSRSAMPVSALDVVQTHAVIPAEPATDLRQGGQRRKIDERRTSAKKASTSADTSSIRVATEKVDRLIDLVGELVISQVMTAQMVEDFDPSRLPKLRDAVAAMERSTRELHERVMAVRMMPVGTLFQRYVRVIHDIAQSTGKQIRLELGGEETEIDKSMLELLGDPLTHLIRNSADHGIESSEARVAAGKPEEGVIQMRAFHRSGKIVIEIEDDGAGIDTARVRAKAVERGLIDAEAELTEEQIRMLIFAPGFSTRDAVSDLSGRGVGMDVVRRNVQQLSGSVAVTSVLGSGSTVSIELPLTLAILEGLLVRVMDRTLVLPLLAVVEAIPCTGKIVRFAEQAEVIVIRGESIPVLRLVRFLGLTAGGCGPRSRESPDSEVEPASDLRSGAFQDRDNSTEDMQPLVVVVETGRKKIGLVVDELLGQQQVVVKSLEKNLRKIEGLMGATILGDGRVAPIVDVTALAESNLFAAGQQRWKKSQPEASSVAMQPVSVAAGKGSSVRGMA